MSLDLLAVLAVVAAAISIVLLGVVFFAPYAGIERDVQGRLGSYASHAEQGRLVARIPLLGRWARSAERAAAQRGLLTVINDLLESADVPISAGEALLASFAGAVLLGVIGGAIFSNVWLGLAVGIAAILAIFAGLQQVARREKKRFEEQLPDTLNLLASSLRAGYSLLQAVEAVAKEAPEPTRREFGRALQEIRLGQSVPQALHGIAARMSSVDFEWTVMAVDIQREVGGNLAEVLTTTAETILARQRLKRDISALTAEARLSAVILIAVPLVLFGILYFTNRDYLDPLFETTVGQIALGGSVVLIIVGIFWMRRIVDIEV